MRCTNWEAGSRRKLPGRLLSVRPHRPEFPLRDDVPLPDLLSAATDPSEEASGATDRRPVIVTLIERPLDNRPIGLSNHVAELEKGDRMIGG